MKRTSDVFLASILKPIRTFIYVLNLGTLMGYSSCALSNEASLLGHWDFYVPTTKGVELVEIEVSGISGKYQGVYRGEDESIDMQNIVIDGSSFSFAIEKRKFLSSFTLTYSGTVEDGRINGYVDTPMGPKSYRAVR